MTDYSPGESLLDLFLFETEQSLQQLEESILACERNGGFAPDDIHLIFRIMHTIKGSAAVMGFNQISLLAHAMEDQFYYMREQGASACCDCSRLSDLILQSGDFIRLELIKIRGGDQADGEAAELIDAIHAFLQDMKEGDKRRIEEPVASSASAAAEIAAGDPEQEEQTEACGLPSPGHYRIEVRYAPDCEMANIRAFILVRELTEYLSCQCRYSPADIAENPDSSEVILREGFHLELETDVGAECVESLILGMPFVERVAIRAHEAAAPVKETAAELPAMPAAGPVPEFPAEPAPSGNAAGRPTIGMPVSAPGEAAPLPAAKGSTNPSASPASSQATVMIQVNVSRLDKLMDLVGELVIAEAMVAGQAGRLGLEEEFEHFVKATRQLRKITSEVQETVMSMRMVPLSATFRKMNRVVRDMNRKLGKEAELVIVGEETEVDKNVIEHISDPLMHVVRNALDHGIETPEARKAAGKSGGGKITLEARHAGGDVVIAIRDDGKGLNREAILRKASANGLIAGDPAQMCDKDVFAFIFHPGFSTKETVSEFSGRGVGMDVVVKELEKIGGTASVDSMPGEGSVISFRIPLTLAIMDGMNVRVGASRYTLPITAIAESFRPGPGDVLAEPGGAEMIVVRGQCLPVVRMHRLYASEPDTERMEEGVLIRIEQDDRSFCLFADELLGQQQVVIKALPGYIRRSARRSHFLGCTLLGDGGVSLIPDIGRLAAMLQPGGSCAPTADFAKRR
ncbi:chemotaxis protein CheA [Paenibacillus spiritus]|uniref:Chemotaxis protein CheA n=1 Tax=Paenibacillus spiritus TaxID=2496557 RepID=A0A5J5GA31_9BACL|nr:MULTISPECIES: chemotaxis protein CheA [Paenibacillus]KAA9003965.1 chemotaxis protein CheA [Paenibacillus spiritus]